MPRQTNPKTALVNEIKEIYRALKRKHKRGETPLVKMSLADLQTLCGSLMTETAKMRIIAQIKELSPGKRIGRALSEFTLDQLRVHLAKLRGESLMEKQAQGRIQNEYVDDPYQDTPFSPPVSSPMAPRTAQPTMLTLTFTFSSMDDLRAFCEKMKGE